MQVFGTELEQRRTDFQDSGIAVHSSALEEVEQEREIEYEVETVREVQMPVHMRPYKVPKLHRDLEDFAKTSRLPAGSDAYQSMPFALTQTALGAKHGAIIAATMASSLFVSTQFMRTVVVNIPNDNFLRPCQWILWSCSTEVAVVVTPEEADSLIPILRSDHSSRSLMGGMHLIVYAAPVTRRMLQFNHLDYYAVPPLPHDFAPPTWLKIQLGIFSGRLYFDWDEYVPMLGYLGVLCPGGNQDGKQGAFGDKPLTFRKLSKHFSYVTTTDSCSARMACGSTERPRFRTHTNGFCYYKQASYI